MADEERKSVLIEDAHIIFRNFAGKEGMYNQQGERNFAVILPVDVANQMLDDGWNVKYLKPRDDEEERTPFLSVTVRFDIFPPRVVLITSNSRTQLDESSVEVLDWANIQTVDLIARGRYWNVNGKEGIKAYLQSMFVTIEEDELERKYAINDPDPG